MKLMTTYKAGAWWINIVNILIFNFCLHRYLNNIRPEYSRVYKIKDSVTARPQTKTTSLPRLRTYPPTRKWSADSSGDGTNLRRDLMFSNDQRKEKPSPVISQNSAQTLSRETILLQIGLLLSVLFQL